MKNNISIVLAGVAIVIALFAFARPMPTTAPADSGISFGRTGTEFPHGVSIGPATATTNLAHLITNNCSLIAPSFTVTASTTVAMDCAVTGAVSTDLVFAQFATSTAGNAGWLITGASASSTAGYITMSVINDTGANGIIPAAIASSTKYMVVGTQ